MRDSNVLYKAACTGQSGIVRDLLAGRAGADDRNSDNKTALYGVSAASIYFIGSYYSILLLLKAGANPLLEHSCNQYYKTSSPFLEVVDKNHLALARLYVWYIHSDYEDLRVQYSSGSYDCSFERHINIVGVDEAHLGRERSFADCLNEARRDAKASHELKRQAEAFIGKGEYVAAAECYSKIAALYKKNAEIEKTITYYRVGINIASNAAVEEYRPILIAHYYAMSREFLELADKSFDWLDNYPNQASATMHTRILNALIESDPSYGSSKPSKTLCELLRRTAIASLKRLDDEGADHTVVKSHSIRTASVAIEPPVPSSSAAAGAGSSAPLRDKRTSNASTVELTDADFDGSPLRRDSELETNPLLDAGLFVKPALRQRIVLAKAGMGADPTVAAFIRSG